MLKNLIRISSFFSRVWAELNYAYCRLRGQAAKPEAFEALLQKLQHYTPEQFNEYIRKHFTYKADKIDFSMHYLVFLHKKQGDCDDYAHLCAKLLERMGYDVSLVCAFAVKGEGHCVCVGTKDGKSYAFGNWPLIPLESSDFIHAAEKVCQFGYQSDVYFAIQFDSRWRWIDFHQN